MKLTQWTPSHPKHLEIVRLEGPAIVLERLQELGFHPGLEIEVVGRLPFGGPWLIHAQATSYALRDEEANHLMVKGRS